MTAARTTQPTYAQVSRAVDKADPWLSVAEVADLAYVSRMTAYRAIHGEYLEAVRRGRSIKVRTSWYRAWIAAGAPTYGPKP